MRALPHPRWIARSLEFAGIGVGGLVLLTAVLGAFYPRKALSAMILFVETVEQHVSLTGGDCAERPRRQPSSHPENGIANHARTANADLPQLIAHAGGAINGLTYTNSLEAITGSMAQGCTVIEIDLAWTSDNRLVLLHDWGPAAGRHFGKTHQGRQMSYRQFLATPTVDGLTSLGEEDLLLWLDQHPRATIVLDAKWRAMEAFERIYQNANPRVRTQLIAQAYQLGQVETLHHTGYDNVLLTLYRMEASHQELMKFLSRPSLDIVGIAMPIDHALGPLGKKVTATGLQTFAHPVNSGWLLGRLARRNIGAFTSQLCACAQPSPTHGPSSAL